MKVTYDVWWKMFRYEYQIKSHEDVEQSGIYYNLETESYEAHFKPDERTKTKVVTKINEKVLSGLDKSESSALFYELANHLRNYYERMKLGFCVPQLNGVLK